MRLGAIGDDFTGSSDLGLVLASGGLETVLYVGVPNRPSAPNVEAGALALKTRSAPVAQAVSESLAALRWLRDQGCVQFLFKYCSTFDSTPEGNIGPVLEALIDELETDAPVIVCPASPENGRTVYGGHLFVNDRLLSESGMENHPLTPMTDADLRRWLQKQTRRRIGYVDLTAVRNGQARERLLSEAAEGRQIVVCDAVEEVDLLALGWAAEDFPLVTGASGIGVAMPLVHEALRQDREQWVGVSGRCLALSGSCSATTLRQIERHRMSDGPQMRVDPSDLVEERLTVGRAIDWATNQDGLPLIYTSAEPDAVRTAQQRFGRERSAHSIETFFGKLAQVAGGAGFSSLICAGGETSGAVVSGLGVSGLRIGPMIDPGVPALRAEERPLALALKSGNFGGPDFFARAARVLEAT